MLVPLGGFQWISPCLLPKKAILWIKSRIFGQSYGCIWCKCGIISHILIFYLRQNGQNDGPVDWVTRKEKDQKGVGSPPNQQSSHATVAAHFLGSLVHETLKEHVDP